MGGNGGFQSSPQLGYTPQMAGSYSTPAAQGNVFQQSAGAYGQGLGNLQGSTQMNPLTGLGAAGMMSANPYEQQAAQGFSNTMGAGIVPMTMNQYLNPYQNQVIGNTLGRMQDQQMNDLNMVRAQAAQSGAYGGARQGLVEAELMDRYNRNMYEAAGSMAQQGFNTAAQLGQNRINQIQQGASGLAGLGGQRLNAYGNLANLGLAQQQQQLAAGQAQVNAAPVGFNMGQQTIAGQQQAGAQQQNMMQQILGQAANQYDTYANYPQMALGTALAGVQGNPMAGAGTTTQRTTPGLFNYLSLGAGLGSAYMGNPAAMGGK